MRVNVAGHGVINFPDTMSDAEIRAVLKQFEPKKDDTIERLLKAIEESLKNQKPQIVTATEVQIVEVPKIVEKVTIETVPVERMVEVPRETTSWHFTIQRDEDGITDVIAEPI